MHHPLDNKREGGLRFEIYRREGDPAKIWCWRLCRGQEGVVAFGEGYASRSDCLSAVEMLQGTSSLTPIIEEPGEP